MSELAVVKVFSIVEGYPAVVVVEKGFFLKGFLKGTKTSIGEINPVGENCPVDGVYFGKSLESRLRMLELVKPKEWDCADECWLFVADYGRNAKAGDDMVKLVKVLSSVSVDGISVEVRPGVVDVKFVSVENCVLSEDGYVKFLKIWMRMSK